MPAFFKNHFDVGVCRHAVSTLIKFFISALVTNCWNESANLFKKNHKSRGIIWKNCQLSWWFWMTILGYVSLINFRICSTFRSVCYYYKNNNNNISISCYTVLLVIRYIYLFSCLDMRCLDNSENCWPRCSQKKTLARVQVIHEEPQCCKWSFTNDIFNLPFD